MKNIRWLVPLTLLIATVNLVRYYLLAVPSYLSLPRYAAGQERMPFQGRVLLAWPMRWAARSAAVQHFCARHIGVMRSPELAVASVFTFAGMFSAVALTTLLYRRMAPAGRLVWLPWLILLLAVTTTFTQNVETTVLFPYDLLSLAFFTAGLYLIYLRCFWGLLVLFPIATLNRETTLFLIVVLLLDGAAGPEGLRWKRLMDARLLGKAFVLLLIWVALQSYVQHRFAANPTEKFVRVGWNLRALSSPKHWPSMLAACGYLVPLVLVLRRYVRDYRLRAWLLVIWPWLLSMFVYAVMVETRIYGELCGLFALAAALLFEDLAFAPGVATGPAASIATR